MRRKGRPARSRPRSAEGQPLPRRYNGKAQAEGASTGPTPGGPRRSRGGPQPAGTAWRFPGAPSGGGGDGRGAGENPGHSRTAQRTPADASTTRPGAAKRKKGRPRRPSGPGLEVARARSPEGGQPERKARGYALPNGRPRPTQGQAISRKRARSTGRGRPGQTDPASARGARKRAQVAEQERAGRRARRTGGGNGRKRRTAAAKRAPGAPRRRGRAGLATATGCKCRTRSVEKGPGKARGRNATTGPGTGAHIPLEFGGTEGHAKQQALGVSAPESAVTRAPASDAGSRGLTLVSLTVAPARPRCLWYAAPRSSRPVPARWPIKAYAAGCGRVV